MKDISYFDTVSMRERAKTRYEFGRIGAMLGEVLFFNERRNAGWPLPTNFQENNNAEINASQTRQSEEIQRPTGTGEQTGSE